MIGRVKLKTLQKMYMFVVAEDELRKSTAAEARCLFRCREESKEENSLLFNFFFSHYLCLTYHL